jgi:uncharacterized protein (DUF3820 family)
MTMVMPFGKYRTRPLHDVPSDYMWWIFRTIELREPL